MSYFYKYCIGATSEQIQKLIGTYEQELEIARKNRNEAVTKQDSETASKYDAEVIELERALENLSKDLTLKQKEEEENKENPLQKMKDLIRQLFELSETL